MITVKVKALVRMVYELGQHTFYTGVPDSLLSPFIRELDEQNWWPPIIHIPAVHESQALGIAVGAELAGQKSVVYLQNSGLGNLINPITSLCIPYQIYPLLLIGHRHSLPQHKVMGEIDRKMLELTGYENYLFVEGDNNAN